VRIRVKICGIKRVEDARIAWASGADAVGMIFSAGSPRCIEEPVAARIGSEAPPFVSRVGVFVDPTVGEVHRVLKQVPLDLIQFHGSEPPEFCASFGLPFIKAVPVEQETDLAAVSACYAQARGLLLDARVGGSGKTFDWSLWPRQSSLPLLLAGGLSSENIAQAIESTAFNPPWALDVSSGVEHDSMHAEPVEEKNTPGVSPDCGARGNETGVKDPMKIAAFMKEVSRINEFQ